MLDKMHNFNLDDKIILSSLSRVIFHQKPKVIRRTCNAGQFSGSLFATLKNIGRTRLNNLVPFLMMTMMHKIHPGLTRPCV